MADDKNLCADNDPGWVWVRLRVDEIRNETLRQIAQAWSEDPDLVAEQLDKLAAAVDGPAAGWDAAVGDVECDLQMSLARIDLDETQALQLADELVTAASQTSTARRRTEPIPFPQQHGEAAA